MVSGFFMMACGFKSGARVVTQSHHWSSVIP